MEDHEAVLRWPHTDAMEVIVSGDFDQWSNSVHLVKDESGFAGKVRIPWGAKVEYKFLVDGQWKTSDAPVETDPSGRYTNNVYIAPPKPASTVSVAISYVASGLGAAFQNLTRTDVAAAEVLEATTEASKKDATPTETATGAVSNVLVSGVLVEDIISPAEEPKQLEEVSAAERVATSATAEHEAAGIEQQNVVPVTPEPQQSAAQKPEQTAATPELESVTASAAAEPKEIASIAQVSEKAGALAIPEVSTHTPVSFSSKSGSMRNGSNGNEVSAPPAPSVSQPATAAPAATADDKAGISAVPSNLTEPSSTLAANDDKAGIGENALPTDTKKDKHAFPRAGKDEGDGISSRAASSSWRKKRHSIFGGVSEGDDEDASRDGTISRKKTRSFFGKVKHLFDKKD